MTLHVSKKMATRFLLKKQLLFPPQSLSGREGIETVFRTLRVVQYDPLNPCGRNTDLVLQARIKDYHPNHYYHWLYTEKKGIECYDKELCIIPIEDFPFAALRMRKAQYDIQIKPFIEQYTQELDQLLQKIDTSGPVASTDIVNDLRVAGGWYGNEKFGRFALETLWKTGKLVIVKRQNGKKVYDLPHKVYAAYQPLQIDTLLLTREHIVRRLRGVGMLPKSGVGGGWQGIGTTKEISSLIASLIREELLVEVAVEGCPLSYVVLAQDIPYFSHSELHEEVNKKIIFLAPLDNLLWDRQMLRDIFNFDYTWEVYTPLQKRKYGYYVLPILYGDTFIGRVEPLLNKDNIVELKGVWIEPKIVWTKKIWNEFENSLDKFKNYLHADKIVGLER